MYVLARRPTLPLPCVGVQNRMSLMSWSLLHQQCPTCPARVSWMVSEMGSLLFIAVDTANESAPKITSLCQTNKSLSHREIASLMKIQQDRIYSFVTQQPPSSSAILSHSSTACAICTHINKLHDHNTPTNIKKFGCLLYI